VKHRGIAAPDDLEGDGGYKAPMASISPEEARQYLARD